MKNGAIMDRLRANIAIEDRGFSSPCWVWKGAKLWDGYGVMRVHGRQTRVHRAAYTECFGEIAPGMVIDHLCRVRDCANPEHLRQTTHRENILAGTGMSARHATKTHCPEGHPLSGDNLVFEKQGNHMSRRCRECRRRRDKIRDKRRRAV